MLLIHVGLVKNFAILISILIFYFSQLSILLPVFINFLPVHMYLFYPLLQFIVFFIIKI